MATSHSIISLSNSTATLVSTAGVHSGEDITIQNIDATAIVYIGGEGVTASDFGFKIVPGGAWSVELPGNDQIYAISNTNGSDVAILKVSLESQD